MPTELLSLWIFRARPLLETCKIRLQAGKIISLWILHYKLRIEFFYFLFSLRFYSAFPFRLIVSDPLADFSKPTFAAAQALLNNYQKNVTIEDTFTPEQLAEEVAFIDAVMTTGVMQQLHTFLVSKGTPFSLFWSSFALYTTSYFIIQVRPVKT
jgi:hypothetical protein